MGKTGEKEEGVRKRRQEVEGGEKRKERTIMNELRDVGQR